MRKSSCTYSAYISVSEICIGTYSALEEFSSAPSMKLAHGCPTWFRFGLVVVLAVAFALIAKLKKRKRAASPRLMRTSVPDLIECFCRYLLKRACTL